MVCRAEKFLDLLGGEQFDPRAQLERTRHPHWVICAAGWLGLVVGGICFIFFPAAILVAGIAWAYVRFRVFAGGCPAVLYGIKPVRGRGHPASVLWGTRPARAVKSSLLAAGGKWICVCWLGFFWGREMRC